MNPFERFQAQKSGLLPRIVPKEPKVKTVKVRQGVRKQVFDCLLDVGEPITARQVVDKTGLAYRQVGNALRALVATSRVKTVKSGKGHPAYTVNSRMLS